MVKPLLIDLYGGAGAAGAGYQRAGFRVLGIDIAAQPRYPGSFLQADITTGPIAEIIEVSGAVAVHASPPRQRDSRLAYYQPDTIHSRYADLIGFTRDLLLAVRERLGVPFVIENVPRAPLRNPVMLCGAMFPELRVYRHRNFEVQGFALDAPPDPEHRWRCTRNGYLPTPERPFMSVHGGKHSRAWQRAACDAMGVPWLAVRDGGGTKAAIREVSEAIPASYTYWVGRQLMEALSPAPAAAA
uniref:DNA methylase n=1 Tax=Pseudonocardia sp. CA-138482 TaxID=3240023 RepID=UPI003F49865E